MYHECNLFYDRYGTCIMNPLTTPFYQNVSLIIIKMTETQTILVRMNTVVHLNETISSTTTDFSYNIKDFSGFDYTFALHFRQLTSIV